VNNAEYIDRARRLEGMAKKAPAYPDSHGEEPARFFLRVHEHVIGQPLQGGTVLDFGCGVGHSVYSFLKRGFDAFGVDILEFWGKDVSLYGSEAWDTPAQVKARLRVTRDKLPFADESFDLVVSDQVLEHVFDLPTALSEIARVLKPGALAIHRFPNPNGLVEAHTGVPFVWLNRYQWYLKLWALLGWRNSRQRGMNWRDAAASSIATFGTTHYLPNREVLRIARIHGDAWFAEYLSLSEGRAAKLQQKMKGAGLGWISYPLLSCFSHSQVLVIRKRPVQAV